MQGHPLQQLHAHQHYFKYVNPRIKVSQTQPRTNCCRTQERGECAQRARGSGRWARGRAARPAEWQVCRRPACRAAAPSHPRKPWWPQRTPPSRCGSGLNTPPRSLWRASLRASNASLFISMHQSILAQGQLSCHGMFSERIQSQWCTNYIDKHVGGPAA